MDDVRRVARQRMVWVAAAAAAVLLASTATAYGWYSLRGPEPPTGKPPVSPATKLPGSCQAQRLPLPDGTVSSFVSGGDRGGRYLLGRSADAAETQTVLIWRDGALVTAASMPGADGTLDDINSSGDAIGNSVPAGGGNQAFRYRAGEFTELTGPGDNATALAIGEQGTVVGWREIVGGSHQAVVWQAGQTGATDLQAQLGQGDAIDVDDDGTIVGLLFYPIEPYFGMVWRPDGTSGRLARVNDGVNDAILWPTSISNGVVAGRLSTLDGFPATLDLKTGTATVLKQELGKGVTNGRGWFAGRAGSGLALLSPNGRTPLEIPASGDAAGEGTRVRTLSEDGRVLGGQVADAQGTTQAVMWSCR
jgi:hypothetical protein